MKYKKLNVTGLSQEHSVFYWVGGRRSRFPGEFLEADKSEKDRKWIVGYKTADIGKKTGIMISVRNRKQISGLFLKAGKEKERI